MAGEIIKIPVISQTSNIKHTMLTTILSSTLLLSLSTGQPPGSPLFCPTCYDTKHFCSTNFQVKECLYRSPYHIPQEDLKNVTLYVDELFSQNKACLDAIYEFQNGTERILKMCVITPDFHEYCDNYRKRHVDCFFRKPLRGADPFEKPIKHDEEEYEDDWIPDSANLVSNAGLWCLILLITVQLIFC